MTTSSSASRSYTRDIAYIAVFAALIIALGFFSIPLAPGIPIVLQNIACILAGLILGPRRGTLAVALTGSCWASGTSYRPFSPFCP